MAPGLAYASWRQSASNHLAARALLPSPSDGSSSSGKASVDKGHNLPVAIALNRRQAGSKEEEEEQKPVARPPGKDDRPQPQPETPRPAPDAVDTKPETRDSPRPAEPTNVVSQPEVSPIPEPEPERPPQPQPANPSPTTEDGVKPAPSVEAPQQPPVEAEPTAPEPEPITTPAPAPTTTRRGGLLDGITGGLGDVVGGITSAVLPPPPPPATSKIAAPVTTEAPAPAPSPPGRPGLGDVLDGIIPGPPVVAPATSIVGEILPTPVRPPPPPAESVEPAPAPPTPPAPGGGIISQILDDVLPSAIPVPNIPSLPEIITPIIRPPQPTQSEPAPPPVLPPVLPSVLPPILPSALPSIVPPVLPPVLPSRPAIVLPSAVPSPAVPDIVTSVVVPPPVITTVAPVQQPSRLPIVPSVSAPAGGNDVPVVVLPSPSASTLSITASSVGTARPSIARVSSSSVTPSATRAPGQGIILAQEAEAIETGSASITVATTIPVTSVSTGTFTSTLENGSEITVVTTRTDVSEVRTVTTIPKPTGAPETVNATSSTSNPAVMGGAIGGAVVALIGILVAVLLFRRRRQNNVRFSRSISPEDGFGGSPEPKSYLTVPPTRHSPRERKTNFAPQAPFEPEMSQSQVLGPAQYSYDFTLPSRNAAENPFLDQPSQLAPPVVTVTAPGGEYVTPSPANTFAPASAPISIAASENTRTLLAPANGGLSSESQNPFADPVLLPPIQRSAPLAVPATLSNDQTDVEKDPFEDPSVPTKYLKFGKDDSKLGRDSMSTVATGKRDTLRLVRGAQDVKRDSVASTAFTEDGKVMIDAM